MFPHTITVWSRSEDETYTRTVIHGVLWGDNRGVQLRKNGVSADNGITVIIPLSALPERFAVRPQDWMSKGEHDLQPASAGELAAAGAVMVSAVDCCDFGDLANWEVTGR